MNLEDALNGRLLDEREAARILGCSSALMRKMRLFRTGPAYCKIGRLVRYAERDLTAYIDDCRKKGA
jgi:hypothetical protein